MNSHELHSETGCWSIPKTPWVERFFHLCQSMSVEDENHFLLDYLAYTHIRYGCVREVEGPFRCNGGVKSITLDPKKEIIPRNPESAKPSPKAANKHAN